MNKKLKCFWLFAFGSLFFLLPILSTSAISDSDVVENDKNTRIRLTVSCETQYWSDDVLFSILVEILFINSQAFSIKGFTVTLQLGTYLASSSSKNFGQFSFPNEKATSTLSCSYSIAWGKQTVKVKARWIEDLPSSTNPEYTTNWFTLFSIVPDTFLAKYYWIFIIIPVVVLAGVMGYFFFFQREKWDSFYTRITKIFTKE
ncbi:MAG: hypothetical protein ACTSUR_03780 [Candidatus Heimdallarchaeaceae archaeon]